MFFGILVALNLQTSFLTPPMAMSAYYLKGIAPPHVQLMRPSSRAACLSRHGVRRDGFALHLPALVLAARTWSTVARPHGCIATDSASAVDAREARSATARSPPSDGQACLARIARLDDRCRPGPSSTRSRRCRRAARRPARARGPADRPAARHAGRRQGIIDTADMPTEDGTVLHAGRTPAARRDCRGAPARGGRDHPRQDGDHRTRRSTPRQDPQPAQSRAHARRLVSGSAAAVAAGMVPLAHRHPDQRLGDPPGVLLRRLGFKPSYGLIPRTRRAEAVAAARPARRVRPQRGGRGAAERAARGLGRGRSRHAAACASAAHRDRLRRAAAFAAACLRQRSRPGISPPRRRSRRSPSWCRRLASSVFEVDMAESSAPCARVSPNHHGGRDGGEPGS